MRRSNCGTRVRVTLYWIVRDNQNKLLEIGFSPYLLWDIIGLGLRDERTNAITLSWWNPNPIMSQRKYEKKSSSSSLFWMSLTMYHKATLTLVLQSACLKICLPQKLRILFQLLINSLSYSFTGFFWELLGLNNFETKQLWN